MFTNWPNTAWKIQMSLAWMSYCSKFKKTKDYIFPPKLFFFHCRRMHFPPFVKVHTAALLPISGIMLNEILNWKISKFATSYEYTKCQICFSIFHFVLYFIFSTSQYPGFCGNRGIHYLMRKNKVAQKENSNFGLFFL